MYDQLLCILMYCRSSSCNKSEAICVKQLVMYLNTWDNKLLLLPVVFFLDDFFHRSIILIELMAMALHHVEEVPEHFSEQLRQFWTFLWTMQFLSEAKNATCGLSWGRCRCRGRRTCLSELQISSGIRRLAECERIWWNIMTSVTIADHFWWYIMKGFDWGPAPIDVCVFRRLHCRDPSISKIQINPHMWSHVSHVTLTLRNLCMENPFKMSSSMKASLSMRRALVITMSSSPSFHTSSRLLKIFSSAMSTRFHTMARYIWVAHPYIMLLGSLDIELVI